MDVREVEVEGDSEADALGDALRRWGMTYRNAVAGLAAGGGKWVKPRPPSLALAGNGARTDVSPTSVDNVWREGYPEERRKGFRPPPSPHPPFALFRRP